MWRLPHDRVSAGVSLALTYGEVWIECPKWLRYINDQH